MPRERWAGLDDAHLVSRAREGYPEAYAVLVERHRDRAYRVALRLLDNPADAEDVTQDALVQAWESLPRFRGDSAFSTWLYRIVTNRALNHVRRDRGRHALLPEEHPAAPGERPDERVVGDQRRAALGAAIAALPFEQRAPLVLHQFEGCSYEEVATILQLSSSAVKSRIFRARRQLADAMAGWR